MNNEMLKYASDYIEIQKQASWWSNLHPAVQGALIGAGIGSAGTGLMDVTNAADGDFTWKDYLENTAANAAVGAFAGQGLHNLRKYNNNIQKYKTIDGMLGHYYEPITRPQAIIGNAIGSGLVGALGGLGYGALSGNDLRDSALRGAGMGTLYGGAAGAFI